MLRQPCQSVAIRRSTIFLTLDFLTVSLTHWILYQLIHLRSCNFKYHDKRIWNKSKWYDIPARAKLELCIFYTLWPNKQNNGVTTENDNHIPCSNQNRCVQFTKASASYLIRMIRVIDCMRISNMCSFPKKS